VRLFSASFVASGKCKEKPEGAYSAAPCRREAILCYLCGNITTFKCNLKEHNLVNHMKIGFLMNKL